MQRDNRTERFARKEASKIADGVIKSKLDEDKIIKLPILKANDVGANKSHYRTFPNAFSATNVGILRNVYCPAGWQLWFAMMGRYRLPKLNIKSFSIFIYKFHKRKSFHFQF